MALTQVKTSGLADDAVTLAKQAAGTDGQVITYDASGNPVAVGPGTDGQVLTSTGAGSPPAFEDAVSEGTQVKSTGESGGTKFLREDGDGTCSWQTVSAGTALTGSTDNTICTVTGANAIQGEAYLTFNGTGDLTVTGDENTAANLILVSDQSDNTADEWRLSSQVDNLFSIANDDSGSFVNKVEIHKAGNVEITDGDLVIGTAGHGISFAATADTSKTGATMGNELLDDYEKGTWTADLYYNWSGNAGFSSAPAHDVGTYVKIGDIVHAQCYVYNWTMNSGENSDANIKGLPFIAGNVNEHFWLGTITYSNAFNETDVHALYLNKGDDNMRPTSSDGDTSPHWNPGSSRYFMLSVYYSTA